MITFVVSIIVALLQPFNGVSAFLFEQVSGKSSGYENSATRERATTLRRSG